MREELNMADINARVQRQSDEFDALTKLCEEWRRLSMTPVVDDDYSVVRHHYENALRKFTAAVVANRGGGYFSGPDFTPFDKVLDAIKEEATKAAAAWPPFNSAHEGYAVLLEEVDELWDHVKVNQKRRDIPAMMKECIQVGAMAARFAVDVCTEQRGRK